MRSLEFENDDLFGEPGRVYRGAAADINEYSNPLGEFRVSNIEYEELQSAIADALGYNWNDAEYEALVTPLYQTVDDPLADFFDNVLNDNPRSESDRYVEQLVSVLKSNYQRFGTEPRAAIYGATRALEHGYSMARAVDIDDDITESDNDNDLFGDPTKQSKLSALKIHADLGPEFSQYLLGLPTQDEDNREWFAELTPEEMREYRAIAQAFARGTRAGYQRMHQSKLPYMSTSIDEIVDDWEKGHILWYQYNGSMPLRENDDDLFEPQTGGKFWSNEPQEYQRLYAELVPPHGPASTLEGELLRAASRLYYQYFNNGWFNNVSGAENFLRQFAQSTPAMQRALYTIHPYTRCDTQDLENKQTARQVEIALDTILQGVMRQVQAANGRYHPNTDDMYDMFDYEQPDDDVEPADDYDDYEEPDYDEDDEELNENDDDLFAAPGESGAAAKMRRQTERIVQTVEELVRLSMPDGNPIDYVFPYMLRKGLDMNQLEAILRMHGYQDIYAMRDEIMQSLDDENLDIQLESDDLFEPSQRVKILHAIRGMRRGGEVNGTSLQGKVRTTYGKLLQTFGKPMFGPDERHYDKVTCEWVVTFGDDSVATIYDWKTGGLTPRGEYDWHIGGHRKVVAEYVRVALDLRRDATVTEDDDDLFEPRPGYMPADVVAKVMPGVETFMRYLEDDTDMKAIREQDPKNYRTIIRDFQGAAQELKRGNVIKALAYIENSPQAFDLDDWFLTIILRRTGIDLSDYYDTENDRLNNLFWKYTGQIKALKEYGMSGFQETKMREVREFVEWTRSVVTEDQDNDLFEPTASPTLFKLYKELDEVCEYAQEQGYQDYGVFEMMLRSSQTWEDIFERLGGEYTTTERDIIKAATAEERQDLIQDMSYYLNSLRDELDLTESDRKKKTQTKTDQPGLDPNMFAPKQDQPLARQEPQKDQTTDQPRDIRRASAARTRQATAGITPTDQMRDMLGRLRNIEIDPDLAPYPDTEPGTLPSVDVNTQNLPAVAGANMQAAGVQNPEFYQVAALPGNIAAVIRQLGKNLFASMTSTPTNNIYVVANLGGQGPNSTQEVNAVAGYLRDHGVNIGPGDIDFSKIMPGYQAETNMFSAGGIRWLLVRDFAGQYIYAWPEADSVDYGQEPKKLREAGEPENPSRRGFLQALGAAGLAAAVPGAAAKALAQPAAAAEVPAAAATAAGESGLIGRLWMAAADYWAERMMDDAVDQAGRYDYNDEDDEDYDDEDDGYDDGWDENVRGPNKDHMMPWGETYDIITTPSGHKVLYTSDPEGNQGIFTYEKDGQVRYIALEFDHPAREWGIVVGGNSEEDEDLYHAYGNEIGGIGTEEGLDELFDYIINGPEVPSGHYSDDAPVWHQYPDKEPQADKITAADTTPADIARLAGLVQKGGEELSKVGEPAEPPAAEPPKPQALPAPEKPDFDLTPDLKSKQQEPLKRKPNES